MRGRGRGSMRFIRLSVRLMMMRGIGFLLGGVKGGVLLLLFCFIITRLPRERVRSGGISR